MNFVKKILYILLFVAVFAGISALQYPIGLLIYNLIFQKSPASISLTFFAGAIFEIIIFLVSAVTIYSLRKFEMINDLPEVEV